MLQKQPSITQAPTCAMRIVPYTTHPIPSQCTSPAVWGCCCLALAVVRVVNACASANGQAAAMLQKQQASTQQALDHTPHNSFPAQPTPSQPTSSAALGGQNSASQAGRSSAISSCPRSQPSGLYSTSSTRLQAQSDSAASHASCTNSGQTDKLRGCQQPTSPVY
jgi:hypothetical protein